MATDIVFDFDDTLCDFKTAKENGLTAAIRFLPEHLQAGATKRWEQSEAALYRSFAAGQIDIDGYRHQRFAALLPAKLGSRRLVEEMNAAFMVEVNEKIKLVPGAMRCLTTLRQAGWSCHMLTNGPSDGQNQKIDSLGLRPLLDVVQIGGDVGVFKPDPKAFQLLLGTLQRQPKDVVMVGDSRADDIEPALAMGMRAIHIHPEPATGGITNLATLPEVLGSL